MFLCSGSVYIKITYNWQFISSLWIRKQNRSYLSGPTCQSKVYETMYIYVIWHICVRRHTYIHTHTHTHEVEYWNTNNWGDKYILLVFFPKKLREEIAWNWISRLRLFIVLRKNIERLIDMWCILKCSILCHRYKCFQEAEEGTFPRLTLFCSRVILTRKIIGSLIDYCPRIRISFLWHGQRLLCWDIEFL